MTGARAALPTWTDFMIGATRGRPVEDFGSPLGTSNRDICAETGLLATDNCPNVTTEIFNEGSEPTEYCTTHGGRPLQPYPRQAPLPDDEKLDLRDLDRRERERAREKIRIH